MERCRRSFAYFVGTYCHVETKDDDGAGDWQPFHLWAPGQAQVAVDMQTYRMLVILKARQLGLTWLCVAFALWLMLFHPIATVLMFSLRDAEAKKMLKRLRGMHARLPTWQQQPTRGGAGQVDSQHEIEFANGSTAQALTNAGDSYTASLVIVDEADLLPKLDDLLESLKPTVADGGRMIMVSRSDKSRPASTFKKIYSVAKAKTAARLPSQWRPIFLPWHVRPDRTSRWYEEERQAALDSAGNLDGFLANYPATDAEALAPRTQDKRIPPAWLLRCYVEREPLDLARPGAGAHRAPAVPGLRVYRAPQSGVRYVFGADPAQGNPTSDDSAAVWLDERTGEQVAELAGRHEMTVFGDYVGRVSTWFNNAAGMVEENNHGHTVLKHLREQYPQVWLLDGHMGRTGWVSSGKGKVLLYDAAADAIKNAETTIRSFAAYTQLASIDGSTLRAPDREHDDLADAYALALAGRARFAGCEWATRGPVSPERARAERVPEEVGRWKGGRGGVAARAPAGVFG